MVLEAQDCSGKGISMKLLDRLNSLRDKFLADKSAIGDAFRLEIFYKRYKAMIWLAGIMFICIFIIYFLFSYYTQMNTKKYNAIYNKLLEKPEDMDLVNQLKDSKLFNLYKFKQALEFGNLASFEELSKGNDLISYLSKYELGSFNEDINLLNEVDKYAYGDLAKIQSAYILINKNEFVEAKNILDKISKDSSVSIFAELLSHYLATKVKD